VTMPRFQIGGRWFTDVVDNNRRREDVYTVEGAVMNREYGLTGTNAYPETDCTLDGKPRPRDDAALPDRRTLVHGRGGQQPQARGRETRERQVTNFNRLRPHRAEATSNERTTTMNTDDMTLTATERKQLADLYDALCGVVSECDADYFDGFHKRGGAKMMNELEAILQRVAPAEFAAVAG